MKRIRQEKDILSSSAVGFGGFTEWKSSDKASFPSTREGQDLLRYASDCYASLDMFRRMRRRNIMYYIGNQWGDVIQTEHGLITEEEYIRLQGKTPLKQNLIRASLKTILGSYRQSGQKVLAVAINRKDQKAGEMMSVALENALDINDKNERDVDALEEYLLSGAYVQMVSYTYDRDLQRDIPTYRNIDVRKFFKNPDSKDIMGKDVSFLGDFYDTDIDEIKQIYASTPAEAEELEHIYAASRRGWYGHFAQEQQYGDSRLDDVCFEYPARADLCRVYRIWRLEGDFQLYCHDYYDATQSIMPYTKENRDEIAKENRNRRQMGKEIGKEIPLIIAERRYVRRWMCYHVAPGGYILYKKETPYEHKSHPYVFNFHPYRDGFCWSFVYDFIDQQKMINRMVILNDFLASAQAKGVLMVPVEALGDDINIEDIADQWSMFNGVIKFHARPGVPMPQQVVNSQVNTTSLELLKVELQMMQNICGVHDALQGKTASPGTPSSLYMQEKDNATANILDFLDSFSSAENKRNLKLLQVIQQYYDAPMYIALAGDDYSDEAHNFNPERIKGLQFMVKIIKSSDTPLIRMYQDTLLESLMDRGLIGLELYLQNSSAPFAKRLLQQVQAMQQQMQQGGGVDPAALQQMQQGLPQQSGASSDNALVNALSVPREVQGLTTVPAGQRLKEIKHQMAAAQTPLTY